MKRLFIIRHAKSDWGNLTLSDFERPLNHRGVKDTPTMAKRLLEKRVIPDLIISSTAKRARETATAFAQMLLFPVESILYRDEIYEAHYPTLYDVVKSIPEEAQTVLLFGHNPGLTYFTNDIARVRIDNIPTCGIAAVGIDLAWKDVQENSGHLLWFDYPKNL